MSIAPPTSHPSCRPLAGTQGLPALALALLAIGVVGPAAAAVDPAELSQLSLEELANVKVTTVARRPQPLADAAAAAFVIREPDIRRSGALTLAEALRLAPNLHVTRIEPLNYAISARGFNGYETSNKLQVLIDGRSVYSLLHSGVFWDAQHVFLPDIDRIEVVSGPGGTLWGSNAVNGVINVVTKNAAETTGALVDVALGTRTRQAGARYGSVLGDKAAYRIHAQGFRQDSLDRTDDLDVDDDWDGAQAGVRFDLDGGRDAVTLQGDLYRLSTDIEFAGSRFDYGLDGGNVIGTWRRDLGSGGGLETRLYADLTKRDYLGVLEEVRTYSAEVQHVFVPWSGHQMVWGVGHRLVHDDFRNTLNAFVLDPRRRWINLTNLFVQDEIALTPRLDLTLGLKLERSSFTGLEYLPNIRLAWRVPDGPLLWAAVSRAVRTPSRIDRELVAPGILVKEDFSSEKAVAIEAGYRAALMGRATLSLSAFYTLYDDLRTTEPVGPGGTPPFALRNGIKGESWGLEAWGDVILADWWRLSAGVTLLRKDFQVEPGRVDIAGRASVGNDPDWFGQVRSHMDLTETLSLDLGVRSVDDLPRPRLPGYTLVDARLGWRLSPGLEVSLTGDNLLDDRHTEMTEPPARRIIGRSVALRARWSF